MSHQSQLDMVLDELEKVGYSILKGEPCDTWFGVFQEKHKNKLVGDSKDKIVYYTEQASFDIDGFFTEPFYLYWNDGELAATIVAAFRKLTLWNISAPSDTESAILIELPERLTYEYSKKGIAFYDDDEYGDDDTDDEGATR